MCFAIANQSTLLFDNQSSANLLLTCAFDISAKNQPSIISDESRT